MVNKVILIGNLGGDPQVRNTQSGTVVANFSLATNQRWNDANGDRREHTEWHQVACFARLADIASQYLTKGRQVYVEGRLRTNSWQDRQTGETRYRTEIVAERLQMLGGGAQAPSEPEASEPAEPEASEPAEPEKSKPAEPAEPAAPAPAPTKRRRRTTKKKS